MKHTLHYYWHVFWQFRKMRFMAMTEYRSSFFFWTFISTMWAIFNFFFFTLIVGVTGSIGNWTQPQLYLLFAIFTLIDAFTWSWFFANMRRYTQAVFLGDLQTLLQKPIDTQFLLMVQDNSFEDIFRLAIGAGALMWALSQLHSTISWWEVIAFVILFIAALFFLYSVWFVIATLSFWVERLDNVNDIVPNLRRLWQVPRQVYSGFASTFFTVILPLGLISSVPSEALVGKFSLTWSAYLVILSIATFCFSRWFFFFSLKKYTSVGN